MVRKCQMCGEEGHDARKCPSATNKRKRRCSICELSGHDRRTCPQRGDVDDECRACDTGEGGDEAEDEDSVEARTRAVE